MREREREREREEREREGESTEQKMILKKKNAQTRNGLVEKTLQNVKIYLETEKKISPSKKAITLVLQ